MLVFGGFAFVAYAGSAAAVRYVLDTAHLGLFLLHRFLSMGLFVYFMSINVGNLVVSYATFYRSAEVSYFLTKPVSHTGLFVAKFLDNFFYSSAAFFLLALAVLLGYGTSFHLPWTFYLQTLLFMLLPFMLIAGCTAVIMLLLLMRFAEAIGVRRIVILLVVFYLGSMYGYFALTSPLKLVASVMEYYPRVDQYLGQLDPAMVKYFPNHWIAESLYWTVRGDASYALSYTILVVAASAAVFALMVAVARKTFYASWIASLNLRMAGESRLRLFSLTRPARIDVQTSVLVKKEIWQFLREPSQWIHVAIIAMLITTFVASILQINLHQSLPLLQSVSYMVILLFNAFLIASIALRFVFPSVSIEGNNIWAVYAAPVDRGKWFGLKFLLPFVPVVALAELLSAVSHHSLSRFPLMGVSAAIVMFGAAFALVGLNLGAGTAFANFGEKNPIRAASSQSATLTFLLSILYLTTIVAIMFFPVNGYFGYILRDLPFDTASLFHAAFGVLAVSVVTGGVSLGIGLSALKRDL